MSPEYFHNALTFGEADDYLGGLNRRCRHGYAQARMVQSIIGQLFAKDYKVQEFPWEEEERTHPGPPCEGGRGKPPTEEEMKDLLKEAREWEKRLNGEDPTSGPLPSPPLYGRGR